MKTPRRPPSQDLAPLDRTPTSDMEHLWREAEGRSSSPHPHSTSTGRRSTRGLTVALAVAATAGSLLWLTHAFDRPDAGVKPGASTSTEPPSAPPTSGGSTNQFVPATQTEGDRTVSPVTFPDGSAIELSYPSSLGIAEMGATPYGAADLPGCCSKDFSILYRDKGQYPDTEPVRLYSDGRGGSAELWRAPPEDGATYYLVWSIGPWTVRIADGGDAGKDMMTDDQRALWATHLAGHVASDGYLVLEAEPPLELRTMENSAGPQIIFGGSGNETVKLARGSCHPPTGEGVQTVNGRVVEESTLGNSTTQYFGQWCDTQDSVLVQIYGAQTFVDEVLRDIVIR